MKTKKYIYKITYPNEKIYVGQDVTGTLNYFGSSANPQMEKDFSEEEMKQAANWGFNSVRVMLTYRTFFDEDANTVDLNKLKQLDKLVAAAMRYNLHLNLVTMTVPGRWRVNSAARARTKFTSAPLLVL